MSDTIPSNRLRSGRRAMLASLALPLVTALVAAAAVTRMIWPMRVGPVGFDSAASVIHFDRIVAGARLEAFVTTTPKPLLTVIYGLTHALLPDWRVISFEAIAAYALAVLLATMLATRLVPACPRPVAALAVGLALVGSGLLVQDVGQAYAMVWALVGWLIAALAATARPARPWLVGVGLLVATLARLETAVVPGVMVLAMSVPLVRIRMGRTPGTWTVRRIAVAVAIAALALPIMLVHDWLLTGDPLFWAKVSASFSAATASIPSAGSVALQVREVISSRPLLSVAAAFGVVVLWRSRHVEVLAGLAAMVPGLGILLVLLAARGTYVSPRYYAGIEIAVVLAGAIGLAAGAALAARAIDGLLAKRTTASRPRLIGPAVAAVGVAIIVAGSPFAPFDRTVRASLNSQRGLAQVGDESLPVVRSLLAPGHPAGGATAPAGSVPLLWGPALLRPRLVVDLDLPLWAVAGLAPAELAADGSGVRAGQIIVHSARFDRPAGAYGILETGADATLGARRVATVATLAGPAWVIQVR